MPAIYLPKWGLLMNATNLAHPVTVSSKGGRVVDPDQTAMAGLSVNASMWRIF